MRCTSCQHENPDRARFCLECGAAFATRCHGCQAELPTHAKFCLACGTAQATTNIPSAPEPNDPAPARRVVDYTPKHLADKILQSKSALEGERKQVTVLFADIQGSMQLATDLDPEQWHTLLESYFEILTDAVHHFEGTVNQYTGDGIMALFGAPIAHEDHAQRACYAALQARNRLRGFADDLRMTRGLNFSFRIGINSGDVVVGKIGDDLRMDYTAQGATVGIAQRIEQLAAPGQVYLSGATERLVAGYFRLRPLGKTELKGLAAALPLFELEAPGEARNRIDVAVTRGLSRFVGRAAELRTLEAALAHTQDGHGQVIGIVGDPGLGKSRLCFEFVAQCRQLGLPVFEAHCVAHGRNVPYLPILELFRDYFDIKADDDASRARQKIAGTLLLLDSALQDVMPVLFEFMGVGDPHHPPAPMDAEAKQRQLYGLVHRVIGAQDLQGQVTITLIDDMHWIDAGSDGFVNQLVSAVAGRRSLVVLNFRPEYSATFATKAHYQQLPLVPLGDAALRALIAELIGRDDSVTELTARIIEWTTGNPFYTEELINALIEAGDLAGQPGQYRLTTALERLVVPTNVRSVLAARIDRLPVAAKRLLQTAAVIGKKFNAPLLAAVTDIAANEQAAAIERLMSGDFIYERALYPVFEYAFKHPLTHEVAYQSQLQSRRAVIHAAVARALEAQAGASLDERAALLAHHYEAAGDILNAARWHQRAAMWAGLNNLNTALHHWQRVRELARKCGADAESTSLLIAACAAALAHGWRIGHSALDCAALFEEGCDAAERAGNMAALVALTAAYGAVRGLNHAVAADFVRYPAEAVRIADRTGDLALRCGARCPLALGFAHFGQLPEAKRVAEEMLALADGDPNFGAEVVSLSPFFVAHYVLHRHLGMAHDPTTARLELARLQRLARDSGFPEQALWLVWAEAEMLWAVGDPRALELGQLAVEIAEPFGVGNQLPSTMCLCDGLVLTRQWQRLRDEASQALRTIREQGAVRLLEPLALAYLGTAHLELGDLQAGRAAAHEAWTLRRESGAGWMIHQYVVLARAQLALSESAIDISRTLDEYAALLARAEMHVYEGELHDLRATLAARENDHLGYAAALTDAHASYTRFGMTDHALRVAALQVAAAQ